MAKDLYIIIIGIGIASIFWILDVKIKDMSDIIAVIGYLVSGIIVIFGVAGLWKEYHKNTNIKDSGNWVIDCEKKDKTLPSLDDYMVIFVQGAKQGDQISTTMKFNHQARGYWDNLPTESQQRWLDVTDWHGIGRAQWLAEYSNSNKLPETKHVEIIPSWRAKK